MSLTVKSAVIVKRIIDSQLRCPNVIVLRYYPRWTHRRPVGVVENEITEQERFRWKLNVERKVNTHNNGKKLTGETDSVVQPDSISQSASQILLAESKESDERTSKSQNLNRPANGFKVNISYKKEYLRERNNASLSTKTGDCDSERSSKNSNNNSFPHEKKNEKQTMTLNVLEKRKIYSEEEMKKTKKLIESANKLGVPVFTDLGINDTILGTVLSNVKSRKGREKQRRILLEGKRLIRDALDAGLIPENVFFSRISDLKQLNLPHEGVKIYKITYKKLCLWSDVVTSQGVLATFKTPDVARKRPTFLPLTVICDNVRDPGNLGTILRTCAGVGCQKVILTKGCVDLWEPKVLRAAAGAHFRMSICQAEDWDDVAEEIDEHACVCIAENKIAENLESEATENLENTSSSDTIKFENEEKFSRFDDRKLVSESIQVPIVPYYALNYPSLASVVLIIGGESEGVSSDAYKFATTSSGLLLNIPLSNNVESLNSGTALSVIAFEIKKQFLTNQKETAQEGKVKIDDTLNLATVTNV